MQQANWCDEHVRAAVALCRARGIPVNDKFLEVL
jgi:transglutaminase-like putative cysteine protease